MMISRILLLPLVLGYLMTWCQAVTGHGGVAMEDDMCVIKIGFLKAHFTGYQPKTYGSQEFCEDIPEVANSVFVIDYLHDFLKEMQVDFRIIRDINNFGIFANWDDITGLEDIEQDTVFYQPPVNRQDGVLTVNYNFQQAGGYIGIVTAAHPEKDKTYNAVFFFQVGGSSYGYIPLFIALVILAQVLYWHTNRKSRKSKP